MALRHLSFAFLGHDHLLISLHLAICGQCPPAFLDKIAVMTVPGTQMLISANTLELPVAVKAVCSSELHYLPLIGATLLLKVISGMSDISGFSSSLIV
jgi:hypothetical protein